MRLTPSTRSEDGESSTAAGFRCIILQGIQNWFLNDDKNEPDNTDPIIQIGKFQFLKATFHTSTIYCN
jgi:hypothetical protein